MTIIALLNTVAIATEHLADGNAAIVFQDLLVLSYILMSDVVVPVLSSPPTTIGGEQLGIMAVLPMISYSQFNPLGGCVIFVYLIS